MGCIVTAFDGLLHSLLKNLITLGAGDQTRVIIFFVLFSCSNILICACSIRIRHLSTFHPKKISEQNFFTQLQTFHIKRCPQLKDPYIKRSLSQEQQETIVCQMCCCRDVILFKLFPSSFTTSKSTCTYLLANPKSIIFI